MAANPPGRCPRCRGQLLEQADQYGRYRSCLTCGFVDECYLGPAIVPTESVTGHVQYPQPVHGKHPL